MNDFLSFDLPSALLKGLEKAGLNTPTPIQALSIPALLEGHDVMASAATGTGKTAAFMIPALTRVMTPTEEFGNGPRVIVLTPTRELAQQVQAATKQFSSCMKRLSVISVVGGAPFGPQLRDLARPVEVLIATPGRLIDHMERGKLALNRVEMLVLDEADRMLDMGFIDDVRKIANQLPPHQTALFSATLEGVVGELAKELTNEPKKIAITTALQKAPNIDQRMHWVDDIHHKQKLLSHLLTAESMEQAIIFTATKRDADALADILNDNGHRAAALHGDMRQQQRTRTLQKMRAGGIDLLVATDVAARGLDVSSISHVINYDLPMFAEDYVHRIGRTGRAGAAGTAISFVSQRDRRSWFQIQKFTGLKVEPSIVEGLEPKVRADAPSSPNKSRTRRGEGRSEGGWDASRGDSRRRSASPSSSDSSWSPRGDSRRQSLPASGSDNNSWDAARGDSRRRQAPSTDSNSWSAPRDDARRRSNTVADGARTLSSQTDGRRFPAPKEFGEANGNSFRNNFDESRNGNARSDRPRTQTQTELSPRSSKPWNEARPKPGLNSKPVSRQGGKPSGHKGQSQRHG